MRVRIATPADAPALARIYNQGIEDRTATFETDLRSEEEVLRWFDGAHPVVVVEDDAGEVAAFARASSYRYRECYRGVFEFAVYTDRSHRRKGAATLALRELVTQARAAGAWKLVTRIFVENEGSRALVQASGFREVGVYYRHAKLDGRWRDVVVIEKFLAPVGGEGSIGPPQGRLPREELVEALKTSAPDERARALEAARARLVVFRRPDAELLAAAADAFFVSKLGDAPTRGRFVELFRAYGAIAPEAGHEVAEALFDRLARRSIGADLDLFYEVAFVLKQVSSRADIAPHVPRLLAWMREAIELPPALRGRISPGNLSSLLMTLALSGCEGDEQKRQVAALAAAAKSRHRVEPPASIRPPLEVDASDLLEEELLLEPPLPKPPPLPSAKPPPLPPPARPRPEIPPPTSPQAAAAVAPPDAPRLPEVRLVPAVETPEPTAAPVGESKKKKRGKRGSRKRQST